MAFPTQYLFTILEVSARWGCTQAQIVDWAIAGELDLLFGFSPVRFGEASIGGLMSIDGNEVRPLFRQHAESAKKVFLTQARHDTATAWQRITEPPHGVRVMASDIVISADEIARFEATHEITRKLHSGPGTPSKYEPPRVYRRAKLSENCRSWNRHQRREPRSHIRLSSANVRCGWRWNTAMIIKAKLRR